MARSSQAKSGRAARATPPKASARRAAVPAKASGTVPTAAEAPQAPASAVASPAREVRAAPADAPVAQDLTPADGTPGESPPAEPAVAELAPEAAPAPAVAAAPAAAEPAPAADSVSVSMPWATGPTPDLTAIFEAGRTLVEGSNRVRGQMIGIGCREAEHGFAVGRAMLAGGSLPEVLALQAEYLGRAVDDALAQTLELGRLSTEVVRAGLEALRPR
jgi:hypothetical protein